MENKISPFTCYFDMAQFHIDNYHLVTKNRYASAHGGLAFYIHNSWNFKIRQDTTESPLWEEMFVDIIDPNSPSNVKFCMGNFYRPPHAYYSGTTETIYQIFFSEIN